MQGAIALAETSLPTETSGGFCSAPVCSQHAGPAAGPGGRALRTCAPRAQRTPCTVRGSGERGMRAPAHDGEGSIAVPWHNCRVLAQLGEGQNSRALGEYSASDRLSSDTDNAGALTCSAGDPSMECQKDNGLGRQCVSHRWCRLRISASAGACGSVRSMCTPASSQFRRTGTACRG